LLRIETSEPSLKPRKVIKCMSDTLKLQNLYTPKSIRGGMQMDSTQS